MQSNNIQLNLAATPTTSSPQKTALGGLSNANSERSEFSSWLQSRPNAAAIDRRSERSGLPQEGRDLPAVNSRSEIKTNPGSSSAANAANRSQGELGPDASQAVNSRPSVNPNEQSSGTQNPDTSQNSTSSAKSSADNSADSSVKSSVKSSAKSSQSADNNSGSANAKNGQASDLKSDEASQAADAIEGGVAEGSVVIGADGLVSPNLDESALSVGAGVDGGEGVAGEKAGSGPQTLSTLASSNPQVMMELGTGQSDGSASDEVSQMDRSSAEAQRLMAATAQGVMASSGVTTPSQGELAEQANGQRAKSATEGVQAAEDVSNGRLVDAAASPDIVELARTLSSDASSGNATAAGSSGILQAQTSETVNSNQPVTSESTVADSAAGLAQTVPPLESGSVQDNLSAAAAIDEAQARQETNRATGANALLGEVESNNPAAQSLQADADQAITTGAPISAAVSGVAQPQSDSSRAANGNGSVSNSINAPQPVGINSNPASQSASGDQSGGDGQAGRNQSGEALAAALDKAADKGAAKGAEALAKAETLTPAGTSTSSSTVPASVSSAEIGVRAPASLMTAVPPQALQRMQQPQWGNRLGERTLMMVQQGPRVAFVQLDPPELGALQVRVHLGQGDQVSLNFSAPNAAVKDVIEQHMPRLREMFAEQGLNLAQSDVRDQSTGGRDRGDGESQGRGVQFAGPSSDEDELLFEEINIPVGRVDYYA